MKKLFAIVICVCLLACAFVGCGGENTPTDGSSTDKGSSATDKGSEARFTVPDFSGKSVSEIEGNAEYKDLCAIEFVYDFSSKIAKDKVISQLPVAGETFDEKPSVVITVSKGPNMVKIPDINNKTMEDARKVLEDIGFTVIVYQEANNKVEKGLVYSVSPAIGTEVSADSEVTIYVSLGAEEVNDDNLTTLPNLVGKSLFDAERMLADAGLTLGETTYIYSDTVAYDYVCSMSIEPGQITFGAVVDLVVSLGPETNPS